MSISEIITTAVKETCLPRECKACERRGLPILLLRKALVPDIAATSHLKLGDTYPLKTKQGLRTLREGYLYVLLDQKYWQAYEITEQGYLRRFNPYQCTPGSPAPLPTRCMHKDHDLPSSFLTVDTVHYSTAWLAFSDDPWTASVLDAYKDGRAPAERFQSIDLKAAREDPASIGLAVTHKRQTIRHQVFEYAEHDPDVMVSARPFHSRGSRIHALPRYIEAAERQHKLKNSLLAYVLEDPLGMFAESTSGIRAELTEAPIKLTISPMRVETIETVGGGESSLATIAGSVTIKTMKPSELVNAVTLTATYWPDNETSEGNAQKTIMEIKS